MKLLENKVALITGGSRGIGKSIVEKFVLNGCNVAFTYNKSESDAKLIESNLSDIDIKIKGYKSNAAKYNEAETITSSVINDFGKIDILVNNAGITKDNFLLRMTEDDFNHVLDVNLNSVFNMTKAVQKEFLKNRYGSIINISSIVGIKGNAGQSNYSASKAGIIGFTKSIALELGSRNIRSNAVAPGFIETEMTKNLSEDTLKSWYSSIPLKRGGKPSDIGNVCVFLASDMSSYITGQVLVVDGGMLT
ncbi:MAG: 3-oxoacyl-[acyl-carrier-protein] reductase [Flavobacteriaceae bacterium TMED206]|nr:3-oxoacyl-[acyl-carrier-protein] reductase [Flavobacteriaceae bacterium]RPG62266.1 MAG: 3-oxoacyl-[acyl-carrier-protein] reductase [Flavobacteriaceae bacterium TMED206]